METIVQSPGFIHIAKKIIGYWQNRKVLVNIMSLRLACKSWNAFLSDHEICKLLREISRKRIFLNIEICYLLDKANQINDRELSRQMFHFVLRQVLTQVKSREEIWLRSNFHSNLSEFKGLAPLEMFICTSSYEFVKDLFSVNKSMIDLSTIDIQKIMVHSTFIYAREDMVKLFLCLYPSLADQFAKYHISDLALTICRADKFPHVQEKLTDIFNLFPNQAKNMNAPNMVDMIQQLEGLHGFVHMTTMVSEHLGQACDQDAFDVMMKNKELFNVDVLKKAEKSSIVREKLNNVLKLFVHSLKYMKYPEIGDDILQMIHKLAALRGFVEVATIVAEKLDKKYVDFASKILMENTDWIKENVLNFMASKIDQNDVKTIKDSKISSLHIAALERNMQFIVNFAPFSTTIHEKDQNGKNALSLVLDSIDLSQLEEKAAKVLMDTMQKVPLQTVQQNNVGESETKLESKFDFLFGN